MFYWDWGRKKDAMGDCFIKPEPSFIPQICRKIKERIKNRIQQRGGIKCLWGLGKGKRSYWFLSNPVGELNPRFVEQITSVVH